MECPAVRLAVAADGRNVAWEVASALDGMGMQLVLMKDEAVQSTLAVC